MTLKPFLLQAPMIRPKPLALTLAVLVTLAASFARAQEREVPREPAWLPKKGLFGHGNLRLRALELESKKRFARAARKYSKMGRVAQSAWGRSYAHTRAGDCYFLAKKYNASAEAYSHALTHAAQHVRYDHILDRLYEIVSRFERGAGRWFGPNRSSAIETLEIIVRTQPKAEDRLRLADLYRNDGNTEKAAMAYRTVIRHVPNRTLAQEARFRLANMLVKRARFGDEDGARHREAASRLDQYLAEIDELGGGFVLEARSLLDEIRAFQAELVFDKARFYTWELHWRPRAAVMYLDRLLQEPYDDTPAAERARKLRHDLVAEIRSPEAEPGNGSAESIP